jgi:hypothetical protein
MSVDGWESFGTTTRTYPASSTFTVSGRGLTRTVVVAYSRDRDDTDVVAFSNGAVLLRRSSARLHVLAYTAGTELAPSPPIPLLPGRAQVGQRFSGSFAGNTHGTYAGSVERRERLTVDGVAVDTVVTETIRYSGQASGTTETRTWWDVDRLLPLRQRVDSVATTSGGSYEQHVTIALQRLTPS